MIPIVTSMAPRVSLPRYDLGRAGLAGCSARWYTYAGGASSAEVAGGAGGIAKAPVYRAYPVTRSAPAIRMPPSMLATRPTIRPPVSSSPNPNQARWMFMLRTSRWATDSGRPSSGISIQPAA